MSHKGCPATDETVNVHGRKVGKEEVSWGVLFAQCYAPCIITYQYTFFEEKEDDKGDIPKLPLLFFTTL